MTNLFEYQNKVSFDGDMEELEAYLEQIWSAREKNDYFRQQDSPDVQRFIQVLYRMRQLKSGKYVGAIHFNQVKINLFPKIFYQGERDYVEMEVAAMHKHILWWLSYCRKIKFPSYKSIMGSTKSDFFEVLIYLFAKYTRTLLSSKIYQRYEQVSEELGHIRGSLNITAYLKDNISKGQWNRLSCDFDAFELDNKFNRVLKYVAKILLQHTRSIDSKTYLRDILFILDTVQDVRVTSMDCQGISFNPMFADFITVRDYCQLFLDHCISLNYNNEFKLFAFLLPMEYVFEDFIFGFLRKEMQHISVRSQTNDKFLDRQANFAIRPDLILEFMNKSVIADAKYKIIYLEGDDAKSGISQNDIYQMIGYGIRYKINHIIVLYPACSGKYGSNFHRIDVPDEFAQGVDISISCYELPIINEEILKKDADVGEDLFIQFENTKNNLILRIDGLLKHAVE